MPWMVRLDAERPGLEEGMMEPKQRTFSPLPSSSATSGRCGKVAPERKTPTFFPLPLDLFVPVFRAFRTAELLKS